MRKIRKIKEKVKRLNINVPIQIHNSFKAATAAEGLEMTAVLLKCIKDHIARHGYAPKKKGRRK